MLELENISFYHRTYRVFYKSEKQILSHISLKIESGRNYAIMGNSGCGKSTLAQIMCGILSPSLDELGQVGQVRFNVGLCGGFIKFPLAFATLTLLCPLLSSL